MRVIGGVAKPNQSPQQAIKGQAIRETRLNRSELAVPGNKTAFFEKAAASKADVIFLDLEDSVAPSEKALARRNIIAALHDVNWDDVNWGRKTVSVRVNAPDTPYCYRDIVEVMEQASERLDLIMIPKVNYAADIYALDLFITQIEAAKQRKKRVGFEIIIETPQAMQNIDAIAAASPRNESLHYGPGDYAASIHAHIPAIGELNPDYAVLGQADANGNRWLFPNDMLHYEFSRMVIAARANGLRPIDGAFANFADMQGFTVAAKRSLALGFEGKWAIHPSQIEPANQVMTPNQEDYDQALRVLEAMKQAEQQGQGVAVLDGKMIDYASSRGAEMLVKKMQMIRNLS
ncbi:MAG: CoA ester lyase [Alphaproteobacteria bacterium]|nr:CoA ester lyase [Alphaproteobacteria bacterium]